MAVQYAPLFSLEKQFIAKDGALNTAGFLRVYLAATDDPADTYSDYLGTRNQEKIVLDDNGRAVVICDKAKAYRLEVYDADGMLLWTEEPVYCSGAGGGGVSVTEVVSTDGSIDVESSVAGSLRTYDLSIAPDNAKELLEWVKTWNEAISDGPVYPVYIEGTMDVFSGQGIEISDAGLYHVTVNLDVIPSGNGINYETLSVFLMLNDGSGTPVMLCQHDFDVDNSLSDKVELEFAYDLTGNGDGKLYLVISGSSAFHNVDVSLQMHRVYSGIAAVPGSIASKAWVEQNISSKIDYSALEYNQQNLITAISGSAIASDPVNPNEFIPWSASGTFQPSGSYLSSTDSALFQPSGEYLSASESANYYPMTGNPSGFITDEEYQSSYLAISAFSSYSSVVDNSITSISSVVSGVSGTYLEKSASSMFQESGNYVSASEMSAYAKASSLEDYQLKSAMSAYAYESSLSSKLDSSAFSAVSGTFLTAVPEGYATESYVDSAVSGKLDVTASSQFLTSLPDDLAYTSDVASAVSGKLDASASSEFYPMTGNPSGFLTAHQSLSGYATVEYVDSSVSGKLDATAYDSAQFLLTSQSGMFAPSGNYVSSSDMSAYVPFSGLDMSAGKITAISGTALSAGKVYTGINPVYVDNTADNIGVYHKSLVVDETMTAYASGDSAVIGVNTTYMADFIPVSALGLVEI